MQDKKRVVLGTDERYLACDMDVKLREEHMHIMGAPRSGKSRFMLSLILQDLKAKRGLCVIDPHGELVDHVKDWLAKNEMITKRRRVHVMDYRDLKYSFGFNPLHVTDDLYVDATVERAVDAVATAATGDGAGGQHLIIETLTDIFTALAYARLTLVEAQYLLTPDYPAEREAILELVKNPTVRANWERHKSLAKGKYLEKFDAAARRINRMIGTNLLRPIVGQSTGVIDLKKVMDDGDIALIDLSLEGGYAAKEGANLVGRLFVSSMVHAAFQRTPRTSKAFNLYIDEVHKFLTHDVSTILDECPKFGLHLTFAHQHLGQLLEADEQGVLLRGIMASAQNKICFRLGNPDDADVMQRRIFAGHYNLEIPKYLMDKPVVVGHRLIETESRGSNISEAKTSGIATAEAISQMESTGHATSTSTTNSESQSTSVGQSSSQSESSSVGRGTGHTTMTGNNSMSSTGGSATDSASMGVGMNSGSTISVGAGITVDEQGNPVATTDNVGGGESVSMMSSMAAGVSHSASHNIGSGTSSSTGTNVSETISQGRSVTEAASSSSSLSAGVSRSLGETESFSAGTGQTRSSGQSEGVMQGTSTSHGVSQSLMPILEERHTTLYSLEELKHQFTDNILLLPKRTALATISGTGMVKITSLDTPDIAVSPTRRKRVIDEIKRQSPIHKLTSDANTEIENRYEVLMRQFTEQVIDTDPMKPLDEAPPITESAAQPTHPIYDDPMKPN